MRPGEISHLPREPTYQPLVLVATAVAGGIVADRYFAVVWWTWLGLTIVGLVAWFLLWRRAWHLAAMISLALAVAAIGGAWHHAQWSLFAGDDLSAFATPGNEPVGLEAVVTGAVRHAAAPPYDPLRTIPQDERSLVELQVTAIRDRAQWRAASGRTLLFVAGDVDATSQGRIRRGDRLRIFGHLAPLTPPDNPGEFDYAADARSDRRLARLAAEFPEAVVRTAAGSAWQLSPWIDRLRAGGVALLHRNLAPNEAGLASAMFLGVRDDLEPERYEAFQETGIVHVLVISGFNVAIQAMCLMAVLNALGCSARTTMLAVAGSAVLYALVTGGEPPVVRATVMVLLICGARLIGKRALEFNLLGAAALAVLAINPSELFRAGAQLSFLGMAALITLDSGLADLFGPLDPLDRLIARSRAWPVRLALQLRGRASRLLLVSLVVWIVVAPLVAARFHLFSPAAIVLTPLVALPVSLAMAAGFGVLALGSIVPPAAMLCGWACDAGLRLLTFLTKWAAHWPGSHFWVSGPSDWWLLGWYGGLALWTTGLVRPPRRWNVALAAGWCALGLGIGWASAAGWDGQRRLDCTFVSVGHGSAVVVRLPGGKTLLYDAGCMNSPLVGQRAISAVLWSQGIRHLDAVILSHADADHYNALPGLLKKFSAGAVHVTPLMFDRSTPALDALAAGIAAAGVPLDVIASGDRLQTGDDCTIEVLHPPRKGVLGSDNANSIVLAIEYQQRRILLTGDLENPGLDDVLAERPYDADLLLAPHHGSRFSDPPGMATWSSPEFVVISGSRADWQPAVAEAYSSRGGQVLHTAHTGAIRATITGGQLSVISRRDERP
jgi:competence protein ComEC